ncbi:MAG: Glycine dehydrogenase (decarboxylating) [Dehalococcoidia bacterium]|nr:Glycine dehydrogenase (decarboxylating) [Dehalococcoidia bacterium]
MLDKRRLLMDRSVPGRRGVSLPACDVPMSALPPTAILREDLPLPEVSQPEIVRYFTHLSSLNFGVDSGFYPLGSCTMKYNPKLHEEIASLPGIADIHPLQDAQTIQGALQMLYEMQTMLAEIAGLDGASLAPIAGAHGEFAGLQVIRAYQAQRGQSNRKTVLIPDTAHGTNPASAAMCGYGVVSIPSDKDGNMDRQALRAALSDGVVALMVTNPSTLGLFEQHIVEICQEVHEAGGLVYGDGANLNALLGKVKLGELGFDVVHMNLHKTFTTPHGGGGPGAGAICVRDTLKPFLPSPLVVKHEANGHSDTYSFEHPGESIGPIGAFYGNFGNIARAYTYIRSLGPDGLREVSENAVLHANYIRARLSGVYNLPYARPCMHEVIFSASNLRPYGVRALDVAKRLIDYGYHPPTMYFPLKVDEALMIEPTETESKETMDEFIEAMITIANEAKEQPALLKEAPHNSPVRRLDEARAARQPDLRWKAQPAVTAERRP